MTTTIYGTSDDLLEIEGDIREEINVLAFTDTDDGVLLAFSNGIVLRVVYDKDGIWRIRPLSGSSRVTIEICPGDDENNYTDRAIIEESVNWVVLGYQFVRKG